MDDQFEDRAGMLEVASDDLYQRPERHPVDLLVPSSQRASWACRARTLRALYNARKLMTARWRNDPVNLRDFMAILQ